MGIEIFDQDDEAYFQWMDAHPNGFVVNSGRTKESNYYVLHRSHCTHITRSDWRIPGAFTERTFIKVCSPDPKALANWGGKHRNLGGEPFSNVCGTCEPISDIESVQEGRDFPDEIPKVDQDRIIEGAKVSVLVNRYERDPRARKRCIRHHGATCHVCAFDFSRVYGPLGEGFIHVHHLKPLSSLKRSYEVDPIKDLRPVCPNCHAMLHKGGETLSIQDLKRVMREQK